jgi:hypothetical protein
LQWPTIAGLIAFFGLVWALWKPIARILKSWWEAMEAKHRADKSKLELLRVQKENQEAEIEERMHLLIGKAQEGSPAAVTIPESVFAREMPDIAPADIKRVLRRWKKESSLASSQRFRGRFS